MNRVCLVTGVGPGTGSALVRRFVADDYDVAMIARNAERLESLAGELEGAHPYVCDVVDREALARTYARIKKERGAPSVIVHNAVGAERGTYMDVDPDKVLRAFEINTIALLQLAQLATPDMLEAGGGAILCTGNTSAYRGRANFAPPRPNADFSCQSTNLHRLATDLHE